MNGFFSLLLLLLLSLVGATTPFLQISRGGASSTKSRSSSSDAYHVLAQALASRMEHRDGGVQDVESIEKSLQSLSTAQQALKALDGAAHEAYQRTHSTDGGVTSVRGRARRSAARASTTADAFLAAELCELLDQHQQDLEAMLSNENGTLSGRAVLLKEQHVRLTKDVNISFLVLWEPSYDGGAGLGHGGIEDLVDSFVSRTKKRGRLLVIVGDPIQDDLLRTMQVLDAEPLELELKSGLVANEIASVHPHLYRAAGRLVWALEPTLLGPQFVNKTKVAIHFVGQSLAGGVASLAAVILDGSLPMPHEKRRRKKTKLKKIDTGDDTAGSNATKSELDGFGRGRSSAMVLGAPPCLSANVKASFVKSVIYGDDVVCRTSQESIARLCQRTERAAKGGAIGRRVGWMADVVGLTVSSMKSHARGSEGEEGRLVVPGQAFLIRPRRFGGSCSMHEVAGLKGGREALRAAVLWQLNDVLLSKSLWKHHSLMSYLQGLDKVQLRGLDAEH